MYKMGIMGSVEGDLDMKYLIILIMLCAGCASFKDVPYNNQTKWAYMGKDIYRQYKNSDRYVCRHRVKWLSDEMKAEGVTHYLVYGYYNYKWDGKTKHVWIEELNGDIIDPSIGWFGKPNEFWVEETREKSVCWKFRHTA